MLTRNDLKAGLADLKQRYRDLIPRMTNRAHLEPRFMGLHVDAPDSKGQVAVITVYIEEKSIGIVSHEFRYGVFPDGVVQSLNRTMWGHGASWPYQHPIDYWIDDLLLEKASKERTQVRTAAIAEELAAAVWAPARVERLLERGGWSAVEAA